MSVIRTIARRPGEVIINVVAPIGSLAFVLTTERLIVASMPDEHSIAVTPEKRAYFDAYNARRRAARRQRQLEAGA